MEKKPKTKTDRFFLLKEWLTEFGKEYKINNLRHLQNCCAGVTIQKGNYKYSYHLPDGWIAEKLATAARGTWIIRRKQA